MKFRGIMQAVTCLLLMMVGTAFAQSPNTVREFVNTGPWIPVLTAAPANTVSSASLQLIYTDQPDAGDTITISAAGHTTEIYEFYATTYSGDNIGIKKAGNADDTYTTAAAVINANSLIVNAQATGDSNALTLYAAGTLHGTLGNYIDSNTTGVANLSSGGSFTGGAYTRAGRKGSIVASVDADTGVQTFWVKTTNDRITSGSWLNIPNLNTDNSGHATIDGNLTVEGNTYLEGTFSGGLTVVEVYNTTSTAKTILASDSGRTFAVTAVTGADNPNDSVTLNLPDAAAGIAVSFIDADVNANNDLIVNPADNDAISTGSAGVSYNATGDGTINTLTLEAINGTTWVIKSSTGTWTVGS